MSIRAFPQTFSSINVAVNQDDIISALYLPANSRLNNVWMDVQISSDQQVTHAQGAAYGLYGYVIPIKEPDTYVTPKLVWDQYVPKDRAVGSGGHLDAENTSTDTDPKLEFNLINYEEMVNLSQAPIEVFSRTKFMAPPRNGVVSTDADGGESVFWLMDEFKAQVKKNVSTKVASWVMFGLSSPQQDSNVGEFWAPNSLKDLGLIQFLDIALEEALKNLIGFQHTGGGEDDDDPYNEALVVLSSWMERYVEQTSDLAQPVIWNAWSDVRYDISVRGMEDIKSLSGG